MMRLGAGPGGRRESPDRRPGLAWVAAAQVALVLACAPGGVSAGEAERIAEVLRLGPGISVADVGAGSGDWTIVLAERVGPGGRVWATEVDEDELERIAERSDAAGLENVTTVLGDQEGAGLPAGCCDAILLRMVYHHFTRPARMRRSLHRALRPDGRLAVIDIVPQTHWRELKGVPDRGGHGIPPEQLIEEMTSQGFVLLERFDSWDEDDDRFCLVFGR